MTRQQQRRGEHGFTVVELLITLVLLGILLGTAGLALWQALTVISEAGSKTKAVTQRQQLLLMFADDIAQSQSVTHWPPGVPFQSGTRTVTCPATASGPELLELKWTDIPGNPTVHPFVYYRLNILPGPNGTKMVTFERQPGNEYDLPFAHAIGGQSKKMFQGYCIPGDTIAQVTLTSGVSNGTGHKTVELVLSLADTPRSRAYPVAFNGTLRADS